MRYGWRDGSNPQGGSRPCPGCATPLPSARARYCSAACKQRAYRLRQVTADGLDLASLRTALQRRRALVTHTIYECPGCTVRQFPVGKTHTGKDTAGRPLGFKTLIKPSATAQKRHLAELAQMIRRHRQSRTAELVTLLNRKIRGWANYYSAQVSKRVFSRLDHLVYEKLKPWAERRHPTKPHGWVRDHYWHRVVQPDPDGYERVQHWVFGPRGGPALALHASTVIRRHTKVEGGRSLYDGDLLYWASRLGRHPELPRGKAILLQRQRGRCAWCGRLFQTMDEVIEFDHIHPRALGGPDGMANRQLLHGHCHDAKTAQDGSNRRRPSEVPMTRAEKQASRRQLPCGAR